MTNKYVFRSVTPLSEDTEAHSVRTGSGSDEQCSSLPHLLVGPQVLVTLLEDRLEGSKPLGSGFQPEGSRKHQLR